MAKKKKLTCAKGAAGVHNLPRNTVSLSLDGTLEEYQQDYERCHSYFRYWMLCKAAVRVRIGNRLIFTTPIDGTFYFCLRYRGRYIVFPIVARMAWLVGFYTANGVFQMDFEGQACLYMDSELCEMTGFSAGHGTITATWPGDTWLGLYRMRNCFDMIADYRGPHYPEPPGFRPAIGTVVIHLMEVKFREIFIRSCKGIIDPTFSRLGLDFVHFLIKNWSSLSEEGMAGVDDPDYVISNHGIEEIRTLSDILDGIFFLHVDAYNKGIFLHEQLPPAPREMTWWPIDPGHGDGDIPLPDQRAGARAGGHKRSCVTERGDKDKKRRRRELTGGGAGGPPVVPEWFINWEQRDDELQCNDVEHHLSELGLHVSQQCCSPAPAQDVAAADAPGLVPPAAAAADDDDAPGLAPAAAADAPDPAPAAAPDPAPAAAADAPGLAPAAAPDPAPAAAADAPGLAPAAAPDPAPDVAAADASYNPAPGADAEGPDSATTCDDLALSSADLQSLEGQNMLLDSVINLVFAQMSSAFSQQGEDDLVLVPPGLSLVLGNLQDPGTVAAHAAPLLRRARLVLFPVNDNDRLDQADGGTHWSLLVLHIAADGTSSFIHHDSLGGANLPHARRLADALRPLLRGNAPVMLMEGPTPHQEPGSNDCGLYVLAVSQIICAWWRDGGRFWNGSGDSWFPAVVADVSAARVRAMRAELRHYFKDREMASPS